MKMETKPNVKLNFRCEYIHPPARATTFLKWHIKENPHHLSFGQILTLGKTKQPADL